MYIIRRGENGSSIEVYVSTEGFVCADCSMGRMRPYRTEGPLLSHVFRHGMHESVPDSVRWDIESYFAEQKPEFSKPTLVGPEYANNDSIRMAIYRTSRIWFAETVEQHMGDRSTVEPSDRMVFDPIWRVITEGRSHGEVADDTCTEEILLDRHREWGDAGIIADFLYRYRELVDSVTAYTPPPPLEKVTSASEV